MADRPLLEVEDLTLAAGSAAASVAIVDRVHLGLERGEALGLVGESGCGKTLTALALLRLLPEGVRMASGSIRLDGVDLAALEERELRRYRGRRIGMVFQDPAAALNPVRTVGSQVEEVLELHRPFGRAERRREALRLLADAGLPAPERTARCYAHELSGGQCQRALLAIALAGDPDLLVADEPTTALDVTLQAQVLDLLRRVRRRRGLALLWIGHDLGVAAQVCDRLCVMYAGRIVESGPLDEVLRRPLHPYTQGLLAAIPTLERTAVPRGIPGRVPPPEEFPSGCRFRDRCPAAFAACSAEPPWRRSAAAPGHGAACWLLDPSQAAVP